MSAFRHILFWLASLGFFLIVMPFAIPPEDTMARLANEQQAVSAIFGADTANRVTKSANAAYKSLFVETGIVRLVSGATTTKANSSKSIFNRDLNVSAGSQVNRYLQSVLNSIYGLVFRIHVVMLWLFYVGIFLMAAAVDGNMQRKVKNATAVPISAVQYSLGLHLVIALMFAPLVYMVLPVSVTPWFMPTWAVIAALPLSRAVANAAGFD